MRNENDSDEDKDGETTKWLIRSLKVGEDAEELRSWRGAGKSHASDTPSKRPQCTDQGSVASDVPLRLM